MGLNISLKLFRIDSSSEMSLANAVLCKEICRNISKFIAPIVLYLPSDAKMSNVHHWKNHSIASPIIRFYCWLNTVVQKFLKLQNSWFLCLWLFSIFYTQCNSQQDTLLWFTTSVYNYTKIVQKTRTLSFSDFRNTCGQNPWKITVKELSFQ